MAIGSTDHGNEMLTGHQLWCAVATDVDALDRVAGRCFIQINRKQGAGSEGRIFRHHLSTRRAAWIHSLIVEHDPHVARFRAFDGKPHEMNHRFAQPADASRQSDARMNDKGVDTVRLKIGELPLNPGFRKLIVPEPERAKRKLARWIAPRGGEPGGRAPGGHGRECQPNPRGSHAQRELAAAQENISHVSFVNPD